MDNNTINDYIEGMMALGCSRITFAVDDKVQAVVAVDQQVKTPDGVSLIQHQCVGTSHNMAAQSVKTKALHCARMQPPIVRDN